MNKITFREIPKEKIEENQIPKNQVYKVSEPMSIPFVEDHATHKEQVELDYQLKDGQYGLYANEFRGQYTSKDGCKKADVLACVVDEKEKTVYTLIFDVKSNISAFSDDLKKDEAVITAVKEVRDFLENGNIKNSVNFPNCDMGTCIAVGRITICHKNIPNMISQFTKILGSEGLNIADMTNKSRGSYAYTIIDLESAASKEALDELKAIEGVSKVRVIK